MIGVTTKRYSSTSPSSISCEGTSTPPTKIFLPRSFFNLSISSPGFVRTILVFLSSALSSDRGKNEFVNGVKCSSKLVLCSCPRLAFCDSSPIRNHQFVGFAPKDKQVDILHEVGKVFMCCFNSKLFGMVT